MTTRANFPESMTDQKFAIFLKCIYRLVSTYLVHHGYSATAESFAKGTEQKLNEDVSSIKTRQSRFQFRLKIVNIRQHSLTFCCLILFPEILRLVMSGRMGLAIEHTLRSYPGLLENNPNLMFMLKCRQFVEMVNGADFEVQQTNN